MLNMDVFPTMITPYNSDGTVDYDTVEKYVEWYFNKGCSGIFAVCQSSEIVYLSLEERVKINKTVWNKAKELEKKSGRKFTIVSSGHISETIDDQITELNAVADSGTDALIFITNRFDPNNEGDDVWIENAKKVIASLPEDIPLGLYECPMPYKRLVTPKILEFCLSTKRFRYMKDTCCDIDIIKERMSILGGSDFKLLNANAQTLLESMKYGCGGYCGVMANYHPELYVWLCENFEKEPEKAEIVQALLGSLAFTEFGIPYPLTAKYNMCLEGIPTENIARNKESKLLTDYAKDSTKQMYELCKYFDKLLNIQ